VKRTLVALALLSCVAFAQTTVNIPAIDGAPTPGTCVEWKTAKKIGSTNNPCGTGTDSSGYQNYATVTLPTDFPSTGVDFYRDASGDYFTSFDPETYLATWTVTRTIYVNNSTGNDTTGTGLVGAPYKTVRKALLEVQAGADTAVKILVVTGGADVLLRRDTFGLYASDSQNLTAKRVYIAPDDLSKKIYVTTAETAPSWALTAAQTYTYQTSRTATTGVIDYGNKDSNGIPIPYSKQTSVAAVEANAGSWYTDGTLVYVHALDGNTPTSNVLVNLNLTALDVYLGQSAELFIRNVFFAAGKTVVVYNQTSDYSANKFIAWNCAFADAPGANDNGLSLDSIKAAQIYNSYSAYNQRDGFNFHYARIGAQDPRTYYALLFNSQSYDQGLADANNNNNAFTTHEGAALACVACVGDNTRGPVFAMVGAPNVFIAGSTSTNSIAPSEASYAFAQSGVVGRTTKVYIEDSIASGSAYDLSSDGASVPITLKRFTGPNIHPVTAPYVTTLSWDYSAAMLNAYSKTLASAASPSFSGTVTARSVNSVEGFKLNGSPLSSVNLSDTSTLVRTSGVQTIAGSKTFTSDFQIQNGADSTLTIKFGSGSSTGQAINLNFYASSTLQWQHIKDAAGNYVISDSAFSLSRILLSPGGNTRINSDGSNSILINNTASSGTGGLQVWSGGASPAQVASISGAGKGTFNGGVVVGDLTGCNNTTDKLYLDANKQIVCGVDQAAAPGAGITSLGVSGSEQAGSTQTLASANDTNVTLAIASAAETHTFTAGWTGTLAKARGGAGADMSAVTFPSSGTLTVTVASGTATLGTSSIAANTCAAAVTVTATGTATTDVVSFSPNADITGVTGYTPSGTLSIFPYPTANNVNFRVCNSDQTNAVTPGAVTLNWRVVR
jgi:hypothetical protein